MRHMIMWSALAVVLIAAEAKAQPPGPPRTTPTVSPYINLARSGNSAGLNYYGLVRPQFGAQQEFQKLQGQVNQNAQNINGLQQGGVPGADGALQATGFRAGYMTHRAYFLNTGSGGAGGGGGAGRGGSGMSGGAGAGMQSGARSGGASGIRR